MSKTLKFALWALITLGFVFGFAGLIFPDQSPLVEAPPPDTFQIQRLHIFLFNLASGGTVLLYFSEAKRNLTRRSLLFLLGAILFAVAAFLNQYLLTTVLSLGLALIVETVRVQRFSLFPTDFFKRDVPVARKFHQAALLCLSIGLLIAAVVMSNNQYLHIFNQPDLILDDFFLGFSFPISLLTFSVMFSLAKEDHNPRIRLLREISFWVINLGVIIFFIFIIFQILYMQVMIAMLLFADVLLVFFLFRHDSPQMEQENFLLSGILFLVFTSLTGILITLAETYLPVSDRHAWALLLQVHAYLSLYGWNLSGLAVIIRYDEFPLQLHGLEIILLHWVVVSLLAPLGSLYPVFAVVALPAFGILIWVILFSRGHHEFAHQYIKILKDNSTSHS
jgi:hypothetical protein